MRSFYIMVPWPSGKAKVCKTFIPQFKSGRHLQKTRSTAKAVLFVFNEINPYGICEIAFGSEILLRNVKCLRAWVDLFHFT